MTNPDKAGARARKTARANPNRRNEIVEEILNHLRPFRGKKGTAAVAAELNCALDRHISHARQQSKIPSRTQIQKHAKQLELALMKVEKLLRLAPGPVIWSLYYPAAPTRTEPQRAEDIERAIWKRAGDFSAELKQMRRECARVCDSAFTRHPNFDDTKHACAWGAYGLMAGLSRKKISGTQDGAYRAITSLLYEAISGQQGSDLKRACDDVLRDIRGEKTRQVQEKVHTDRYFFNPLYPIVIEDDDKNAN